MRKCNRLAPVRCAGINIGTPSCQKERGHKLPHLAKVCFDTHFRERVVVSVAWGRQSNGSRQEGK